MSLIIVIISVVLSIFFQNQDFFMSTQVFNIDLYFVEYTIPSLPNVAVLLSCFIFGLLSSFISSFSYKVKSEKIIKLLRSREASLLKLVSSLRQELDKIQTSNNSRETENFNVSELDKETN